MFLFFSYQSFMSSLLHFSLLIPNALLPECVFFFSSTKELFHKFLQRLETDYNPKEYEGNLIKDVSTNEYILFEIPLILTAKYEWVENNYAVNSI